MIFYYWKWDIINWIRLRKYINDETYVETLNWATDHLAVIDASGLPAPLTAKFAICTSLPLLHWGSNMNYLDMLQGLQHYKEAQIKAVKVSVISTMNMG